MMKLLIKRKFYQNTKTVFKTLKTLFLCRPMRKTILSQIRPFMQRLRLYKDQLFTLNISFVHLESIEE